MCRPHTRPPSSPLLLPKAPPLARCLLLPEPFAAHLVANLPCLTHPPFPPADLSADVQTRHDGRSSGYALVSYESVELAQNAILCCNGTDIGGRQVLCRFDRG